MLSQARAKLEQRNLVWAGCTSASTKLQQEAAQTALAQYGAAGVRPAAAQCVAGALLAHIVELAMAQSELASAARRSREQVVLLGERRAVAQLQANAMSSRHDALSGETVMMAQRVESLRLELETARREGERWRAKVEQRERMRAATACAVDEQRIEAARLKLALRVTEQEAARGLHGARSATRRDGSWSDADHELPDETRPLPASSRRSRSAMAWVRLGVHQPKAAAALSENVPDDSSQPASAGQLTTVPAPGAAAQLHAETFTARVKGVSVQCVVSREKLVLQYASVRSRAPKPGPPASQGGVADGGRTATGATKGKGNEVTYSLACVQTCRVTGFGGRHLLTINLSVPGRPAGIHMCLPGSPRVLPLPWRHCHCTAASPHSRIPVDCTACELVVLSTSMLLSQVPRLKLNREQGPVVAPANRCRVQRHKLGTDGNKQEW